jgi:hypothetical protein
MGKLLFNKAQYQAHWEHGDVLLVPFTYPEAGDMHLHEPRINRTDAENAMAEDIMTRIRAVLDKLDYKIVNFSFNSCVLTIKKK